MIDLGRAFAMMQETADSLFRSGVIAQSPSIKPETVLLGNGSDLDSMGFVALMTDLEDRLAREEGDGLYLVLSDIHGFNDSEIKLSAETMAHYLVKLARDKSVA